MAKQSSNPKVVTKKHLARIERERRQINLIRIIAAAGIAIVLILLVAGALNMRVVAKVNGVSITTKSWQERVRLERVNLYNQLNRFQFFQQSFGMDTTQQQQEILTQLNSTDIIGQRVLDQMVDDILVRQEAEKRGITVSEEEVESLLQEAYNFYPNGTPTPTAEPTEVVYPTLSAQQLTLYPATATATVAPTETAAPTSTPDESATATATATAALPTPTFVPDLPTESPTPYTIEGFEQEFQKTLDEFKGYGISERTLRDVYEMQLLRTKLQKELEKDIARTDTQVLVKQILVDSEEEAKDAIARIESGESFEEVAKEVSKDPGSASRGGVYEWAPASTYVAEFRDAALTQEIGVIGEPVKTEYGYHVILVVGREDLPLNSSQYEQKVQTAYNDWLTAARESADKTVYENVWKSRVPTEPVLIQQ